MRELHGMPSTNPSGNPSLPSRPITGGRGGTFDLGTHRPVQPRAVALAQAALYVTTGVWPLVHMRSFEAATGRTRERWLVRTVGLLAAATGVSLLRAVLVREARSSTTRWLGMTTAAAFLAVDLVYAIPGRIRRTYLLDAAAELALLGAWCATIPRRRRLAA